MRIKISFYGSDEPIPKCNQHCINTFIHNKLGHNNEYHDAYSEYNISSLQGGITDKNREFELYKNGAHFYISSLDQNFLNIILENINDNDTLCEYLKFREFSLVEEETFYNGQNNIRFLSPLILKTSNGRKDRYHFYNEPDFINTLKESTIKKLTNYAEKNNIELSLRNFNVSVSENIKNKTVKVDYKVVNGKKVFALGNMVNLDITTNKKVMDVLYNIGIGKSCGSGFGTFIFRKNSNSKNL